MRAYDGDGDLARHMHGRAGALVNSVMVQAAAAPGSAGVFFLSIFTVFSAIIRGRFADSTYGARLFRGEKVAVSRPSTRLGASTEITKKEVGSVRVMREVSHRLVIF